MLVITLPAVQCTSVTSTIHCGHVVTFLLLAATNACLSVGSSEENGVGEDAVNTQRSRVFTSGIAMGWAKSRGPPSSSSRDKVTKRGEVRREWNAKGSLGGLSLHFCPGAPSSKLRHWYSRHACLYGVRLWAVVTLQTLC